MCAKYYRRHQRVQHANSEGSAAGKRLCEVELRIRIVVVVLVEKLNVAVVDKFCKTKQKII